MGWRLTPLLSVLLSALLACSSASGPPPPPAEPAPPTPPVVRDGAPDLVFSYQDPITGAFSTTSSIGAIPEAARASVTVTDLARTPAERQAARYVFIADLRAPGADGAYPVSVASRHALSAKPADAIGASSGVVIYTTSWCGVCTKAKALLGRLGVPFTERDIEASRSAAEELAAKARRAGVSTRGVPVIDVDGVLLQGLDEPSLKAALKQKGLWRG